MLLQKSPKTPPFNLALDCSRQALASAVSSPRYTHLYIYFLFTDMYTSTYTVISIYFNHLLSTIDVRSSQTTNSFTGMSTIFAEKKDYNNNNNSRTAGEEGGV